MSRSQVYGFVKQSGGHAKIYSEVGEGKTIKLHLPGTHVTLFAQDEVDLKPVSSQGGERILVVEDKADVRSYLIEVPKDLNYEVAECPDGASALAMHDSNPLHIDLLLTDIVMPRHKWQ